MAIDTTFNQMKGVNGVNRVNNNTTTKPNSEDKKPVSKTVIGASLVGLAALASVGIYLATKGKGKGVNIKQDMVDELNNQATAEKLKELQKQAKELKEKIRGQYKSRLSKESDNFSWGRSPDCEYAYTQLNTDKKYMEKLLSDNQPIITEFSTKVRNSVKALQNDPDGKELLQLRRQFRKELENDNYENTRRLDLINEIIYTKVNNGKSTPYFKKLGLSVDEALSIVKDKSLTKKEVFQKITQHIDKKEMPGLIYMPKATDVDGGSLYLTNLYHDGKNAEYALSQVKRARKYLDGKVAEKTAQRIRDVRVNIAQETRQSDDVKALKELNRQIAELSKG